MALKAVLLSVKRLKAMICVIDGTSLQSIINLFGISYSVKITHGYSVKITHGTTVSVTLSAPSCRRVCPLSSARPRMCQKKNKTALFFVPLVPGFSTASYLKVHIKTHHGSPLPTIHTFPKPRGELQMHNGNPFHMGRQCLVEGKRPLVPFQTFMFLAFHLLCCFL